MMFGWSLFYGIDPIILDASSRLEDTIRSNLKLRILRFTAECSGLIRV